MIIRKEYLDLVLVPGGLLIMFAYHLFLLHRYFNKHPRTAIVHENNDKAAWVERIMTVQRKDIVRDSLAVISSNLNAATFLASVSLTLSSLIGAWIAKSADNVFESELIYGDRRLVTVSIKYICLLCCFLLAFSFFVQSARHFVRCNYLISMPYPPNSPPDLEYIKRAVEKGGEYWMLGLRSLYFALNMLLWFFGPIPMFISCVVTVVLLSIQDMGAPELRYYPPATPSVHKAIQAPPHQTSPPAITVARTGK